MAAVETPVRDESPPVTADSPPINKRRSAAMYVIPESKEVEIPMEGRRRHAQGTKMSWWALEPGITYRIPQIGNTQIFLRNPHDDDAEVVFEGKLNPGGRRGPSGNTDHATDLVVPVATGEEIVLGPLEPVHRSYDYGFSHANQARLRTSAPVSIACLDGASYDHLGNTAMNRTAVVGKLVPMQVSPVTTRKRAWDDV